MTYIRWVLEDPVALTTWTLPRNPYEMSTPVVPHRTSTMPGGLAFRRGAIPVPWSFKVRIRTQAEYDLFLAWSLKPNAIRITDHLSRIHLVMPKHFDPVPRRSQVGQHWRFESTFHALYIKRETTP